MSELRSAWTSEEVEEGAGTSNESLPEATTTHRFPTEGTAAGADHRAGDEMYEEPAAASAGDSHRVPPDPPLHPDAEGKAGA